MKTSVIEVSDMLSVLSVRGVETRIGEVPGVESVTVNFDAGNATVRYDETRLKIGDIKSAVRQSGYHLAAVLERDPHKDHPPPDASPATPALAAPSDPEATPTSPAATSTGNAQSDIAAPRSSAAPMTPPAASTSVSTPASAEPKPVPEATTAADAKKDHHGATAPH